MDERSVRLTVDNLEPDMLLKAWSRMVSCIGHELTAPLMAMRYENKDLKERLAHLLEGYQLAVQNQLIKPGFDKSDLQAVEAFPSMLGNHLDKMANFAHLVQTLSQKLSAPVAEPRLALGLCLQEAIKKYPFTDEQRHWLHIDDSHDFNFECESAFMEYLFFNLLEGALSRIERMHQGEIHIWAEEKADSFILHFEDTAGAVAQETSSTIFKDFFVKYNGGIVPGLGFCRLKLLYMGGDMVCDAVKDKSTHFAIRFPKI